MGSSSSSSSGIGFCGLLAIVFITLKLLDKIDWSWLWVLAPIWIPAAIVLGVLAIIGIVWTVAYIFGLWPVYSKNRRRKCLKK